MRKNVLVKIFINLFYFINSLIIVVTCFSSMSIEASQIQVMDDEAKNSYFGGRVSRINLPASLIRFKIEFKNNKFLNKKDQVNFWSGHRKNQLCKGYVIGRSNEYLLLKVINIEICLKRAGLIVGSYLHMHSPDLSKNLKMAKDVVEILVKKRVAIESKFNKEKKELAKYVDKIEAVNKRYETLRAKLELEWQQELNHIQSDKLNTLRSFKSLEIRLGEIDHKLEQYRVYDQNMELDRWSLDSRLYYRK